MPEEPGEKKTLVITQEKDGRFALDHAGAVALYGDAKQDALRHQLGGQVVHATPKDQPLVHMVCWDEERACEISGRVALVGDESAPLQVRMGHRFDNEHRQLHRIESKLSEPIHHALQIRTPLQVRFCNAWHVASDYSVEIRMGDSRLISLRLTGATVATPQPCEEPCPPAVTPPDHP